MIISHRLKFAYFRVPKTGSTTVEMMLRMSGAFDQDDLYTEMPVVGFPGTIKEKDGVEHGIWGAGVEFAHQTIAMAVTFGHITPEQLEEYTVVATLRDPYDRFVSSFSHAAAILSIPEQFQQVAQRGGFTEKFGLLVKPQWEYHEYDGVQVSTPMHFDNFKDDLNKVIANLGGHVFELMPRMNRSRSRDKKLEYYDDKTRVVIQAHFARDFALYNRNQGNQNV